MKTETRKEIIATLIKQGRPDLANMVIAKPEYEQILDQLDGIIGMLEKMKPGDLGRNAGPIKTYLRDIDKELKRLK